MSQRTGGGKTADFVIITDTSFPIGYAPTSRILSYCAGFHANNIGTTVFCINPTEKLGVVRNDQKNGYYKNTHFIYTPGTTNKSDSFFLRRFTKFWGIATLPYYLIKEIGITKSTAAIIYMSPSGKEFIIRWLCKLLMIKTLKEESEYPFTYFRNKKHFKTLLYDLYVKYNYRQYDIILAMTNNLIKFFREKIDPEKTILLHVPMSVDFSRFAGINPPNEGDFVITYVGYLNESKDGVLTLLKSFLLVKKENSNIKLQLVGPPINNEFAQTVESFIEDNQLKGDIILRGEVSNEAIPGILNSSSILVLPRPDSKQSEGGFPTKLGEYLASKQPVVVTKVGEIPLYLEDNVSAFLVEPDNVQELADKLLFIIANYSKARDVAEQGYAVAYRNFNPAIQTKNIIELLNKMRADI